MNVFVLCTGRCGSTTFARASNHIENFRSAHELQRGRLRREYPDNHIEVDNSLSRLLGPLDEQYGDDAFYVHLKRDERDTASSFSKRSAIVPRAHARLLGVRTDDDNLFDICHHYCQTVNSNIERFLKDKSDCMTVRLASAKEDFRRFWHRIDAVGSLSDALDEWDRRYNATPSRTSFDSNDPYLLRAVRKVGRVVRKLPRFLRKA